MQNPDFKQLLSERKFLNLWASQLFSQLTINLINFSILTHIYSTTHSSVAVSLLWLAYSLPALFFGPFTGGLVDRFSHKRIMMIANILQAVTIATYLLSGRHIFFLYSLAFIYSALDQFYTPAQQATIPGIVSKAMLPLANGIFLLTQQTSFLIGFGLGSVLLSLLGRQVTIILSSAFLLTAAFFAYRLPREPKKKEVKDSKTFEDFLADVGEGYKLLKTNAAIKFPVVFLIFLQTFITIIAITFPSFTSDTLGFSLNRAGIILIIPGALGALITTAVLPKTLRTSRKKKIIENGLLTAGLSLLALTCSAFLPSFFKVIFSMISAVGLGVSIASALIPTNTLLQETTPEAFRGRVYGVLGFLMTISTTIPLILISSLADLIGTQLIMAVLAVILMGGYLLIRFQGDSLLQGSLDVF
jgi:MFS family permease